ncbi:YbfB/YjiJ family MFS transporter [Aggregicoccus sp. 17bor-14]|uniref:YbfB/YjiJ family MFS transporter n=1 Tax=Myxococcaceae TaxID=31 RepID=UPI00129CC10B|nr:MULTISPECIES: YbfB/YjiJ family MFS transporter [Myxococcaceae]MBF5043860.1 YbfB/YjiJ family MFS transporter [Simulacricoccus sp. 17bor-14]MRI89612.1 YbfB/YjiJ family MFS transporter [Aggregicoccus sp. 17bor-14]
MGPGHGELARQRPVATALALSLGAAVSLGISRFAYGLLLPPMRADLGWSYLVAGGMNTGNALGYLLGALATPRLMRRLGAQPLLLGGALLTALFMALSGFVTATSLLLVQRVLAGVASAFIFISGGLLAARLGALHPQRAGLLIGLYYGGTGLGIALSALLVPWALARGVAHPWQAAWLVLAGTCLLATCAMALPVRHVDGRSAAPAAHEHFRAAHALPVLGSYFLFGVGYIGYMTFVVALLREQGMAPARISLFYALLGLAVMASSRIWARMLDHFREGQSLAILDGLLALATLLPVLSRAAPLVFLSGLLFGAVFLSVVASTTAWVRHNLPQSAWSAGISAFTTIFAFGQIAGPTAVGWIADRAGGLERGLVFSCGALVLGALLATRQQALPARSPTP